MKIKCENLQKHDASEPEAKFIATFRALEDTKRIERVLNLCAACANSAKRYNPEGTVFLSRLT